MEALKITNAQMIVVVVVVVAVVEVEVVEENWVIEWVMYHHKIYTMQIPNLLGFDNFVVEWPQADAVAVEEGSIEEEQQEQKMRRPCNRPSNRHSFVADEEEEAHVAHKRLVLNQNHQEGLLLAYAAGISVVLFVEMVAVVVAYSFALKYHLSVVLSFSYAFNRHVGIYKRILH